MLSAPAAPHDSDSAAQREAEVHALKLLELRCGRRFSPKPIALPDGSKVNIDGFADGEPPILAEVCARLDGMNEGTRKKVLADTLKLVAVSKLVHPDARLMIVLLDQLTASEFYCGWRKAALDGLNVEVLTLDLSLEQAAAVRAAQAKPRLSNTAKPKVT
jgi:hypothetical protein